MRTFAFEAALVVWMIQAPVLASVPTGTAAVAVASAYRADCASCHGLALDGGVAPALVGASFRETWSEADIGALAAYIGRNMPPGASRPLDPRSARQIARYIIAQNSAASGHSSDESRYVDSYARAAAAHLKALAEKSRPVTDRMLQQSPNEDWLVWRGGVHALGYSSLRQIDRSNVSDLRLVWADSVGQGTDAIGPLEHDGVIYLHGGGIIAALAAESGDTIWKHEDRSPRGFETQPRSLALYGTAVYASTVDKHILALDARTGKVIWVHKVNGPGYFNAGPLAANGLVFQGAAGCLRKGAACFIVALNAMTGKEAWRFQTIADAKADSRSWNGAPMAQRSGAGNWGPSSYDYAADDIVFGTGNSYAAETLLKHGPEHVPPALYTNSTIKLHAKTGKLDWYYQHFPGDLWDQDWTFEHMIIKDPRGGAEPIVMTMGKLGILDAMGLQSGHYRWSIDLGLQEIVTHINPKTGAKIVDWSKAPREGSATTVCPFAGGVRNWPSTSYDPDSSILFVPILETCMKEQVVPQVEQESVFTVEPRPGSDDEYGGLLAVDVRTGKFVWTVHRRAPEASAVLATAGGVVFEGNRDRWFRALDSTTGRTLWKVRLSDTPNSYPITFSVDGKQYVAVVTGGGTILDGVESVLTPEIDTSSDHTTLWVFALAN